MKILHLSIIAIVGIIIIVMTSVGIFMKKIDDNSGPLYTGVMITGMKESYTINEPIAFSVMVHGYGSGCGDTKAILAKENDPQYKSQVWGVGRQCTFANPANFEFNGLSANTTINQAGNYTISASFDDSVTYRHTTAEEKFSVIMPKITHYYDGSAIKPKVELYDYYYNGIDKDNAIVSINNQTYYQTTLNYADYDLKKGTSIQFQNVTFTFPEGVMVTPGGAFIMLDVKFPDNSEEVYGENKKNPDGSGSLGGIGIPTQYGLHLSTNSTTVLGNHVMPQAGMTIYNDKIKLLVSIPQLSQQLATTCTAGPGMSCNNQPVTMSLNNGTNPLGIVSLVTYTPPDSCLGLPCPPYTFYLKINSRSTAYLLGYDICGNDLCVKNDTLSILLPISNTQTPNYTFIGISENKKWNYGDTADIKLKISPTPNTKDAYFLYMKNSTIVP